MPFKKILIRLGLLVLFVTLLIEGLLLGLPLLTETLVKARMPILASGFAMDFSVESMGLHRTRIRDIQLGNDIRADSLEILYAWKGERFFQITGIRLSGLRINASVDQNRQVRINQRLFPENTASAGTSSLFSAEMLVPYLPFIPGQIAIDYAALHLDVNGMAMVFPFYAKAVLSARQGRADTHAVVSLLGQPVKIEAGGGIEEGLTRFHLESTDLAPDCLAQRFSPAPLPLRLTGPANIRVWMDEKGQWQYGFAGLEISGRAVPKTRIDRMDGTFDPVSGLMDLSGRIELFELASIPVPMDMTLKAETKHQLAFDLTLATTTITDLMLNPDLMPWKLPAALLPATLEAPSLTLRITGTPREQMLKARLTAKKLAVKENGLAFTTADIDLSAEGQDNFLSPELSPEIRWALGARNAAGHLADTLFTAGRLRGEGNLGMTGGPAGPLYFADARVTLDAIAGDQGNDRLRIGRVQIQAQAKDENRAQTVRLETAFSPVTLQSRGTTLTLDRAGCSGQLSRVSQGPVRMDLTPWLESGRLDAPDQKLSARGIQFRTRISRPFVRETSGHLNLSEIRFQDRLTAAMTSELTMVDDSTFRLTGTLSSPDLINKNLEIHIKAGLDPEPWADCHAASRHFLITGQSVKKLIPDFKLPGQIRLDTTVDAWAVLHRGEFSSRAALEVHSGSIDLPEMNLSVQGITGLIGIRDLMAMESYPGQLLNIKTINAGQFRFENAALRFRIEDMESLGIENLKFNWCNGLVSSEAVQIPAPDGNVQLILFCDRLEMDSLLNQMGAFDAQGGGTLSGRIPVTYQNGGFSFENGFLFSTPGQGGRVLVKDVDSLMARLPQLPKGTPEAASIEMAGEALKDFQYNWATLKMNSQGDTLTVNMELDGKPAKILPFEFRKDLNSLVRVDAKSPGAHVQGIKLDLNLKLPFNQMAKFGKKIKDLMN